MAYVSRGLCGLVSDSLAAQPSHPALVAGVKGVPGATVPIEPVRSVKLPVIAAKVPDPRVLGKFDAREGGFEGLVAFTTEHPAEHGVDAHVIRPRRSNLIPWHRVPRSSHWAIGPGRELRGR